jgi:hypothetical protein
LTFIRKNRQKEIYVPKIIIPIDNESLCGLILQTNPEANEMIGSDGTGTKEIGAAVHEKSGAAIQLKTQFGIKGGHKSSHSEMMGVIAQLTLCETIASIHSDTNVIRNFTLCIDNEGAIGALNSFINVFNQVANFNQLNTFKPLLNILWKQTPNFKSVECVVKHWYNSLYNLRNQNITVTTRHVKAHTRVTNSSLPMTLANDAADELCRFQGNVGYNYFYVKHIKHIK